MTSQNIILRTRADLLQLPAFSGLLTDSSGLPCTLTNSYHCEEDGNSWDDNWSCACDDECTECGEDISPEATRWIGPEDRLSRALWESLPEMPPEDPRKAVAIGVSISDDGQVSLTQSETMVNNQVVLGSDEAPHIHKAGAWPAADAFMRRHEKHLAPDAIVYTMSSGSPKSKMVLMIAAVIHDGRPVPDTKATLRVPKADYAAFYDKWEANNPEHRLNPVTPAIDGPDAPGF